MIVLSIGHEYKLDDIVYTVSYHNSGDTPVKLSIYNDMNFTLVTFKKRISSTEISDIKSFLNGL